MGSISSSCRQPRHGRVTCYARCFSSMSALPCRRSRLPLWSFIVETTPWSHRRAASTWLTTSTDAHWVELPGADYGLGLGDVDGLVDEVEEFLTGARGRR